MKRAKDREYDEFLTYVITEKRINFHPDDSFEDYVVIKTGEPTFTKEEAEALDKKMEYFIGKIGDDVYDYEIEAYA